jgi:hypothetical protein
MFHANIVFIPWDFEKNGQEPKMVQIRHGPMEGGYGKIIGCVADRDVRFCFRLFAVDSKG